MPSEGNRKAAGMDIRLQSVRPGFIAGGKSQVWDGDLRLAAQTFINVTAPSGTGKTSLLSLLYGLLTEYTGTLLLDDQDASSFTRRQWSQLRQRRLSLMFQDLRLFDTLTCLDNVLLKANQVGDANRSLVETAFTRLGLAERMHSPAGTCSQGEKQRVAFIRSLFQPFAWILLDEPFSHLDEDNIQVMCDLLVEACEKNKAGMIVTSLAADPYLPFHQTVAL